MALGERMQRLRKKLALTQEKLAEMLEVQRNTVWRWENGKATPDAEAVAKIAKALDVPVAYLLDETTSLEQTGTTTTPTISVSTPAVDVKGASFIKEGDFIGSGKVLLYEGNGQRVVLPATPENQEWIRNLVAGAIANKTS